MALISVDSETCIKDGLCQKACPEYLIELNKGEFPKPVSHIETDCLRCGHCVAVCPTDSLIHDDIPQEECVEGKKDLEIQEDEVIQFIKSRRSIRNFRNKPVSKLDIKKVLEIARFAPTGHNDQDVRWSVYNSKKGDFIIDDKYTFEIGGKNKKYDQIADMKDSFIAADNIEIGYRNTIPLWLFGFLY